MHLGKCLTKQMALKDITTRELSKRLAVSDSLISKLKRKENWNTSTLLKICGELKLSPDQFLEVGHDAG